MALDKYQTLMTVVDTGSLTRAAEQLGCTQSAVSHCLDALERELGFAVLKRSRAGVTLTGEGGRLLATASFTYFCVDGSEIARNSPAAARRS